MVQCSNKKICSFTVSLWKYYSLCDLFIFIKYYSLCALFILSILHHIPKRNIAIIQTTLRIINLQIFFNWIINTHDIHPIHCNGSRFLFQTPDMQWSYNVRGVLPEYMPPRGRSSRPMAGPHPDPRSRNERMNYIKNNMNLITTAVSSPIKGAPIIQRVKNI